MSNVSFESKIETDDMPNAKQASRVYRDFFKRILDLIISVPVLILVAIPMLIVAVLIKVDSEGPVLFKQERLGMGGKVFNMLKFRSMCVNAEHTGSGVYSGKNDSRVVKKILKVISLWSLPKISI